MSQFHGGISLPHAEGVFDAIPLTQGEVCLFADQISVEVGDSVALGQPIGSLNGRTLRASLSGRVSAAEHGVVKIQGEGVARVYSTMPFGKRTGKTLAQVSPEELLSEIRAAGIVEADGTVLADHLQAALERANQGKLRQAAVSLLEPDPASLSCASLAVEFADAIAGGLAILLRLLSLRAGAVLCDKAYPEAVGAIENACRASRLIAVEVLENRYPQANPKLITRYLCQRELSPASTPEAAGLFLLDAESCIALHQYFATGIPRLVVRTTLWENGKSRLFDLPLGLPLSALAELGLWEVFPVQENSPEPASPLLKSGKSSPYRRGLMDGRLPVDHADRSLTVVALLPEVEEKEGECIRCGSCAAVCPMYLQPYRYLPAPKWLRLFSGEARDALTCIGCGCCSYVCPGELLLRHYAVKAREAEKMKQTQY